MPDTSAPTPATPAAPPIRAAAGHPRRRHTAGRPARPSAEAFRQAILDTARALYRKGGYAAVTMREIATRLGIKAPSLYHHFSSKDDIFAALQERAFELQVQAELRCQPNPDAFEDLREF